ncbi:MAG TPA: hypothetical protein VGI03_15415 [Verrucomicrobiae bacterium]|jgi:hypothetical protein
MSRIIIKPGYIFRFPTEAGHYGYCQWLPHDVRIFLISTTNELLPSSVVELPVAFRVCVFRDTPGRYTWLKIGAAPYPDECGEKQTYAKQDPITKKIYLYRDGQGIPASYAEVAGLETIAVWAHPHIVERLLAQLAGKQSKFLTSVQVKP